MRRVSEEIRKAASVIAARDGRDGLEVLVLERGAGSRFLPGYVAFPGGSTDREDLVLAERWFGTREEAARACAVRELFEEVGLALTAEGLTEASGEPWTRSRSRRRARTSFRRSSTGWRRSSCPCASTPGTSRPPRRAG